MENCPIACKRFYWQNRRILIRYDDFVMFLLKDQILELHSEAVLQHSPKEM